MIVEYSCLCCGAEFNSSDLVDNQLNCPACGSDDITKEGSHE